MLTEGGPKLLAGFIEPPVKLYLYIYKGNKELANELMELAPPYPDSVPATTVSPTIIGAVDLDSDDPLMVVWRNTSTSIKVSSISTRIPCKGLIPCLRLVTP